MKQVLASFVTICGILIGIDSARILGVYPYPSFSHQIVFRALTLELVNRGHEMVVITPNPAFKKEECPKNLVEIDTSDVYEKVLPLLKSKFTTQFLKRGVIMDTDLMTDRNIMVDIALEFFYNTEVDRLIKDKSQKFDLVLFEGLVYGPLIFSELYDAPAVIFSSFYGLPSNFETIGGVARHPILYPYFLRNKFGDLNLLDKIKQLYLEYKLWRFEKENKDVVDEFLRNRFGLDTPSVTELEKRTVLFLTNTHPILDGNRPVPPATVYLGALQLQPTKPLPEDLKSYLDNSTRGVIYVSLGSNVRPSLMDEEFLNAFLDAFENIPFDILWKFDGDHLDRKSKNVKIQKWFPQRDLLIHPKIKLFVMQGGLQSTDEAIDAEVPLVGIPIMGDQFYNVHKYVDLGVGVALDSFTMVADDLVKAVTTVINDPSYKKNMRKLKKIMQDQPETPLERAVWWTEHVLRHKGSRHLLGAAHVSWSEYLMLDVLILLAIVLTITASIFITAIYCIIRRLLRTNDLKVKQQ